MTQILSYGQLRKMHHMIFYISEMFLQILTNINEFEPDEIILVRFC